MATNEKLVAAWIGFLKRNQIVELKSDADGNLVYKRQPTAKDITRFLKTTTHYNEEQINDAITQATTSTPEPAPTDTPTDEPTPPSEPTPTPTPPPTDKLKSTSTPTPTPPRKPTPAPKDVPSTLTPEITKEIVADYDSHFDELIKTGKITNDDESIADWSTRAANDVAGDAGFGKEDTNNIRQQFYQHLKSKFSSTPTPPPPATEPAPAPAPAPTTAPTSKPRPMPRSRRGRTLHEAIKDAGSPALDETQVEKIFSILSGAEEVSAGQAAMADLERATKPPEPVEKTEEEKKKEIQKLIQVIHKNMTDSQRRSLWRLLTDAPTT